MYAVSFSFLSFKSLPETGEALKTNSPLAGPQVDIRDRDSEASSPARSASKEHPY